MEQEANKTTVYSPTGSLTKGDLRQVDFEAFHKTGILKYNTNLLEQAKFMRNNPTQAEKVLWNEVLRNKKTGYKFTRQKPVENFILDFYCSELLLAIEADGEIHKYQTEKDIERDRRLEQLGIYVFRLANQQIIENLKQTKSLLTNIILERKNKLYEAQTPRKIKVGK